MPRLVTAYDQDLARTTFDLDLVAETDRFALAKPILLSVPPLQPLYCRVVCLERSPAHGDRWLLCGNLAYFPDQARDEVVLGQDGYMGCDLRVAGAFLHHGGTDRKALEATGWALDVTVRGGRPPRPLPDSMAARETMLGEASRWLEHVDRLISKYRLLRKLHGQPDPDEQTRSYIARVEAEVASDLARGRPAIPLLEMYIGGDERDAAESIGSFDHAGRPTPLIRNEDLLERLAKPVRRLLGEVVAKLEAVRPEGPLDVEAIEDASTPNQGRAKRRGRIKGQNKIDEAIGGLVGRIKDDLPMDIKSIAKDTGCTPQNLRASRKFQNVYKTMLANYAGERPRGSKTDGRVEAEDD